MSCMPLGVIDGINRALGGLVPPFFSFCGGNSLHSSYRVPRFIEFFFHFCTMCFVLTGGFVLILLVLLLYIAVIGQYIVRVAVVAGPLTPLVRDKVVSRAHAG